MMYLCEILDTDKYSIIRVFTFGTLLSRIHHLYLLRTTENVLALLHNASKVYIIVHKYKIWLKKKKRFDIFFINCIN